MNKIVSCVSFQSFAAAAPPSTAADAATAPPHPSIQRFVRFYIFLYIFYYYLSSICPFQLLRLLLWLCEFRLTESISFILNRIMRVGHVCTNVFTVCHIYVVAFIFFSSSSSSASVVSLVHFYSLPFRSILFCSVRMLFQFLAFDRMKCYIAMYFFLVVQLS